MFTFDVFVRPFIRCDVLFDRILRRMTTLQEKAQTLWWFIETKSITQNTEKLQNSIPEKSSIEKQYLAVEKKFLETGSVLNKKSPGRPCTTDVDVERV
ncbi:hypothetical protein AVEN_179870-1 [Araneus ventricosus]|uniref:Uncharacterized protein n=1 Tax=Araneus ventricosus TaxID=182803 RepID=A0A4Y2KLJ7_ARAVE|nr:hypothetical protein AVEN_179870-1 [Araneus ventricosus]